MIGKSAVLAAGLAVVALAACGPARSGAAGSAPSRPGRSDASIPVRSATLYGVSCTSSSQCMAVGRRAEGTASDFRALAESWNGAQWQVLPMPSPTRLILTQLVQVSCHAPGECVAVGYHYRVAGGRTADLAEEWNGVSWRIIQSANPVPGVRSGFLGSVSCTNLAGCIAVGAYAAQSGRGSALAELWAQGRWRVLPVPRPAGARASELNGISCGPRLCVAVGSYRDASGRVQALAVRWTGSSWILLHPANSGQRGSALDGVSCHGTSVCMAVGSTFGRQELPLAELWTDGRWRLVPGVRVADGLLSAVSCPGRARCIAVGSAAGRPLTAIWAGANWRVLPDAPPPKGIPASELSEVSCRTRTVRCIAVGGGYEPDDTWGRTALAEVWSGTSWVNMTVVNP